MNLNDTDPVTAEEYVVLKDSPDELTYFFATVPKVETHNKISLKMSHFVGFFIAALCISSQFMDMLTSYTWGRSSREGQGVWNEVVLPGIVAGVVAFVALSAMVLSVSSLPVAMPACQCR